MATFLFLVQLLFVGTLTIPAYAETEDSCLLLRNATAGNFTVTVTPKTYQANTTYEVRISDNIKNATKYLLQVLSQNVSVGEWKEVKRNNCNSIDTALLNATQKAANWTSPGSNISSVEIRAYIIFNDKSVKFNTKALNTESTTARPSTTPSSVSAVQSSCFFITAIQLPLLLVTSKLLY